MIKCEYVDKEKIMKSKTNNTLNILRWVILLPIICFTWWISAMICAWIEHFFYTPALWNSYGNIFIILDLLILPTIAVFFISRIIAPKYKIYIGCTAVALCVFWFIFLIYGMGHMAY